MTGRNGEGGPVLPPLGIALRLVRRGVIDPETILHGGFTLEDASRRNRDAVIGRRGRPILFVKQPGDDHTGIDHEASVYRILRRHAPLAAFLSALRHHERGFLVLAAIRGETLADRTARCRSVPRYVARELGRAIASLHDSHAAIPSNPSPPWILSLAAPPIGILGASSAAQLEILRIVQGSREICRGLADLRDALCGDSPLHNDLRFENCLLERRRGRSALKLVDWELAAPGDPAWDVGSGLAAFAALWLFSLRYASGMSMAEVAGTAAVPLGRIRPAARAFWASYAAHRDLNPVALRDLRVRALRFAGARILQLSWERSLHATRPAPEVICALQAAAHILKDSDTAAALLFGPNEGEGDA